jgi:hypothetical protein
MTTAKKSPKKFPRKDMKYQDRFRMTVKEFGRVILIELNRGRAVCSEDGQTVTIKYDDDANRKARVAKKVPAK